jgi:hypothetical protein
LGEIIYLNKNLIEKNILYTLEKNIFQNEKKECTQLYGNTIIEKLKKAIIYTIKTITHGTMILKTLNWLKNTNICQNIKNNGIKKILSLQKNKCQEIKTNVESGIKVKTELSGIKNMQKNIIFDEKHFEIDNVIIAEYILQKKQKTKDFAEITVKQKTEDLLELIMKKDNVYVEKNLKQINIQKESFAEEFVLQNIYEIENKKENVFDIMVENHHHYFAN